MSLLHLSIRKWILSCLKLIFITSLFSVISLTSKAQLPGQLPVNLKAFKARTETNNMVKVFWTTLYEKDNGYFEIQRSADGVNFVPLVRIAGVNMNGITTDYFFIDSLPLKGISFYRLKQLDLVYDDRFSYSPIERVRSAEALVSFDIFPNPAPGTEFKISLLKNVPGNIDVMVFDQSGRLRLQQQFSNNNSVTIYHQLKAGLYNVKITCKEFTETRKIIIQ
jgi:Secretion system C-terminal sorting domain